MTFKSEIGKFGEDLAYEYLVKQNYKIIDRNFRKPWGELDIIAMAQDKTLVFVEVKTMRQCGNTATNEAMNKAAAQNLGEPRPNLILGRELNPEDNLTAAKLKKLQRTASLYASFNEKLVNEEKGWRIDLIAIALENGKEPEIKWFENI